MTIDNITRIIDTFHRYCTSRSVEYVIVGGFSVLVFGRARMTMDIAIIVNHTQINKNDFIEYFQANDFDINRSDLDALDEQIHASIFEKNSMFRVDLKGVYSEIEQQSIELAIEANFNGIIARFDNPNQLIVHKLKFASEQDIEDAIAVYYRSQELIDLPLMQSLASTLGVSEKLDKFLDDLESF